MLTNDADMDKKFISCKYNGIWPDTNVLQKILERSIITVNAQLRPVAPRISGLIKDVRHVAKCVPTT
jgi:hypothetical protein